MFELYLDSVDVDQISRFNDCLPLRGVTCNPSILAASGQGLQRTDGRSGRRCALSCPGGQPHGP